METRQRLLAVLDARRASRPCWRCALNPNRHSSSSSLLAGGRQSSQVPVASLDAENSRREPNHVWTKDSPPTILKSLLGGANTSTGSPTRMILGVRHGPRITLYSSGVKTAVRETPRRAGRVAQVDGEAGSRNPSQIRRGSLDACKQVSSCVSIRIISGNPAIPWSKSGLPILKHERVVPLGSRSNDQSTLGPSISVVPRRRGPPTKSLKTSPKGLITKHLRLLIIRRLSTLIYKVRSDLRRKPFSRTPPIRTHLFTDTRRNASMPIKSHYLINESGDAYIDIRTHSSTDMRNDAYIPIGTHHSTDEREDVYDQVTSLLDEYAHLLPPKLPHRDTSWTSSLNHQDIGLQTRIDRGSMSSLHWTPAKTFKAGERHYATASRTLPADAPSDAPVIGMSSGGLGNGKIQNTREMLRLWKEQHKNTLVNASDRPPSSTLGEQNWFTQSGEDESLTSFVRIDEENDDEDVEWEADQPSPDVFSPQVFLRRGDLVELFIGPEPFLAIFVRNLVDQCQFYTNRGGWLNRNTGAAKWAVSRFVDPNDVNEILPHLPAEEVAEEEMNLLHPIDVQAPRDAGAKLIERMTHFHQAADAVFRANAERVTRLYEIIAPTEGSTNPTYMSLKDIAMKVLLKKDPSELTEPMMWAIHRAVAQCQNIRWNKMSYRQNPSYEVYPQQGLKYIHQVRQWTREYQEDITQETTNEPIVSAHPTWKASINSLNPIASFVRKARSAIQRSRQTRPLSETGLIGPSSMKTQIDEFNTKPYTESNLEYFDDNEKIILHYLDAWTISSYVNKYTNLAFLGSMILRATGMYEGLELDRSRGFTFLQELGVVTPWENKVIHKQRGLRLPGHDDLTGIASQMLLTAKREAQRLEPNDSMEGLRRDWGDMPVFCIDGAGTLEHDDGISLELDANDPSAYWVHIHVADPSAFIRPDSAIAQYAALISESVYFPERKYPMMYPSLTRDLFGLANDRPCITFSAKVSAGGDLLEKKVTPGIVRDVHYLTPQMVSQGLGLTETTESSETVSLFTVGGRMPTMSADDSDQTSKALTDPGHIEVLKKLFELGKAARDKRVKAGAPDFYSSHQTTYPVVNLGKAGGKPFTISKQRVRHFAGDPIINIQTTTETIGLVSNMVSTFMVIAGDVAASWCAERNIPIPYRGILRNLEPASSPEVFRREVLEPKAAKYGLIGQDDFRRYMRLVGQAHVSDRPLEHLLLGLPAYCKATSPLRRYTDLYTHWQIEAALRHEARTGTSLVGSTDDSYLPFPRAHVEEIAAGARHREQIVSVAQNLSNLHWICQALFRAFYFNEAKLPETYEVRATDSLGLPGVWFGWLRLLSVRVHVNPTPAMEGEGGWNAGDVWEARLKAVDTYRLSIVVEPFRLIRREEGR